MVTTEAQVLKATQHVVHRLLWCLGVRHLCPALCACCTDARLLAMHEHEAAVALEGCAAAPDSLGECSPVAAHIHALADALLFVGVEGGMEEGGRGKKEGGGKRKEGE